MAYESSSLMKVKREDSNARQAGSKPVLGSRKWSLYLLIWMATWPVVMLLLLLWQVPLFLLVPFCLLGIGLFVYIMVQRVLNSWAGPQIKANFRLLWGKRETTLMPFSNNKGDLDSVREHEQ